jgi:hypothetical protein
LVVNSPCELQKNGKWERGSKRLEIKMKSSLLYSRVTDMLMCRATVRTWLIFLGISRTLACPPSQTRLCLREIYLHWHSRRFYTHMCRRNDYLKRIFWNFKW